MAKQLTVNDIDLSDFVEDKVEPQLTVNDIDLSDFVEDSQQPQEQPQEQRVFDPVPPISPEQQASGLPEFQQAQESAEFQQETLGVDPLAGEAALTGAATEATLGFLPQIQAGAQLAKQAVLPEEGVPEKTFVELRDENIRRAKELEEKSPAAFGVGRVGGTFIPGAGVAKAVGKVAKGASMAKRLLRGTVAAGTEGFIRNPGDTEGVVDPIQLGERLESAAESAVVGGALQGVFEVGAKGVKALAKSSDNLKTMAELRAVNSTGPTKGQFKKLVERGNQNEVGKELLERNIVSAGDTAEDMLKKSVALKNEIGGEIGNAYQRVQKTLTDPDFLASLNKKQSELLEKTAINGQALADDILVSIKGNLKGSPAGARLTKKFETELKEVLGELGDDPNIQDLIKIRRNIDAFAKFNTLAPLDDQIASGQYKIWRRKMKSAIDNRIDALDKVVGGDELARLKANNKSFQNLATAEDFLKGKVSAANVNRVLGLSEQIGGGAGAVVGAITGGPVAAIKGALAGAALSRLVKTVGGPTGAVIVKKMSDLMKTPAKLGQFAQPLFDALQESPEAFAIVTQRLASESPEFKKLLKEEGNKKGSKGGGSKESKIDRTLNLKPLNVPVNKRKRALEERR